MSHVQSKLKTRCFMVAEMARWFCKMLGAIFRDAIARFLLLFSLCCGALA